MVGGGEVIEIHKLTRNQNSLTEIQTPDFRLYMTEQTMLALLVCTGLGRSDSLYFTISALKQ